MGHTPPRAATGEAPAAPMCDLSKKVRADARGCPILLWQVPGASPSEAGGQEMRKNRRVVKTIPLRISPAVYRAVKAAAEREERSFNYIVERTLRETFLRKDNGV